MDNQQASEIIEDLKSALKDNGIFLGAEEIEQALDKAIEALRQG
jgi:hypothetical protein